MEKENEYYARGFTIEDKETKDKLIMQAILLINSLTEANDNE